MTHEANFKEHEIKIVKYKNDMCKFLHDKVLCNDLVMEKPDSHIDRIRFSSHQHFGRTTESTN